MQLKEAQLTKLAFTSDPSESIRAHLFHRGNGVDVSIKIFRFACVFAYSCVRLRCVNVAEVSGSTRKFATSGQLKYSFQVPHV